MMRVVSTFTKQDVMPFHKALLCTMNGIATHKTTTYAKEQVCIVRREVGQSMEVEAIDGPKGENKQMWDPKHNGRRCGTPRKQLQPDTNDPLSATAPSI
jgi:hypothetical protein